jgi:pyruvate/2-oxoglutarate dehydrogenase complex dihydrolipoamide acyltransferase (E2) component
MPTALRIPRINNNDDTVRLTAVLVRPGEPIRGGQSLAEVETDKATFDVEAENEAYVLAVLHQPGETVAVGSVLFWLGSSPDEVIPQVMTPAETTTATGSAPEPTLKAALLLAEYDLAAHQVPSSGPRLSAADVESFVRERGLQPAKRQAGVDAHPALLPAAAGMRVPLTPEERGMLRTVIWQRDEAVPGYVEIEYDPAPWERLAAEYQKREKLLLSPLLGLMAWRLVRLAAENRHWNATITGGDKFVYDCVNLGFTVQSGSTLYLVVVDKADTLTLPRFLDRLGLLQRSAMGNKLKPHEMSGATISFSSMARWQTSRHIPVLPPNTAIIVAHAATREGVATLGATYDHRVLSGFDAISVLRGLIAPEDSD